MDSIDVDGIVVRRDDEHAEVFYPMPDQPVIPLDEDGNAEFLLIKYLKDPSELAEGEEPGGGYVQFRSTLTLDPERRQRVVSALRARLEEEKAAGKQPLGRPITSTEPVLASPLWTAGQVTLLTFGVSDTGLVRHAPGTRPVDLAGDLGASFAMELDGDGAEIFWSAFTDAEQKIPIMISYELTYKARVSAKMTIHAEREVVHEALWQYAQPYYLSRSPVTRWLPVAFSGALTAAALRDLRASRRVPVAPMIRRRVIRDAIRKTMQESKIEVRIETGEGGGEGTEVQQMLLDVASDVLTGRVIPSMFGDGAAQPGSTDEGDPKVTMDLLEVKDGAPGGSTFDLVLDHQSLIDRSVNPNGPLELLIRDPDRLASSFKELRLADSFFSQMRVTAQTAGVKFESDGIDLIKLDFEYDQRDDANPDRPMIVRRPGSNDQTLIRTEDDVAHWRFDTAREADGRHKRAYRYRTEVHYREGPARTTPWVTTSARQLVITPQALSAIRVELALTASSEAVQSARVDLRHTTPGGVVHQAERELVPGGPGATWLQYTGEIAVEDEDLEPPEYRYQVTYRLEGGRLVMPWRTTRDKLLEIPTPFAKTLVFDLRPQGSFDGVANLVGDLLYEDSRHEYRVRRTVQFNALSDLARVDVPVLEGGPEEVRWTGRLNRLDGTAETLPGGTAGPGTVWIGGPTDQLQVEVLADLIDFDTDVQLALVTLTSPDPSGGQPDTVTFTFSKDKRAPQTWRVGRNGDTAAGYDARIRFIGYDRATNSEIVLSGISDQVLVLDRAAPS